MIKYLLSIVACASLVFVCATAYDLIDANQVAIIECISDAVGKGWTPDEARDQCSRIPTKTVSYKCILFAYC